jgi:hypothetical protein
VDFSSRTPTGEYLLVVYYETGRLPSVKLSPSLTSSDAIRICTRIFKEHGIPKVLKSDNGPAFISQEFKNFAEHLGFTHQKVTPLNPEANGAAERFMRLINKAVRCAAVDKVSWKDSLPKLLRNYRAVPHSSTGISPDVFMSGKDKFELIPTLNKEGGGAEIAEVARANDLRAKARCKMYADLAQHAVHTEFKTGDTVMLKWIRDNKHQPLFDPYPYKVVSVKGNMITANRPGHSVTRNSRFFKKINQRCYERALELFRKSKAVATGASIELSCRDVSGDMVEDLRQMDMSDNDHINETDQSITSEQYNYEYDVIGGERELRRSARVRNPVNRYDANKKHVNYIQTHDYGMRPVGTGNKFG